MAITGHGHKCEHEIILWVLRVVRGTACVLSLLVFQNGFFRCFSVEARALEPAKKRCV